MLNFNYAISLLFEYAAFFKLRISQPDLERPYRIPLNTFGCALFFFPAIAATLIIMGLATFATYYFAIGSWLICALVFHAKQRSQRAHGIYEPQVDNSGKTAGTGAESSGPL
jgi:amino acid transporter